LTDGSSRREGMQFQRLWFGFGITLIISFLSRGSYGVEGDIGEVKVEETGIVRSHASKSSFVTEICDVSLHPVTSISEVIGREAGVSSRSTSGLGQFSTVSIRGSSPEQVVVYLDGVRINPASSGAADLSVIPTSLIDKIEVVRGGGTTEFGSSAMGGVVNIYTKDVKGLTGEASLSAGSFGTVGLGGSFGMKRDVSDLILSWSHLSSENDFSFRPSSISLAGSEIEGSRDYKRVHNEFLNEGFVAKWGRRIGDSAHLKIVNDFLFVKRNLPGLEEETTLLYPSNPLEARERIFKDTNSISLSVTPFLAEEFGLEGGMTNHVNISRFRDPSPAIGTAIDTTTYTYSTAPYLKLDASLGSGQVSQLLSLRYEFLYDMQDDSSPSATQRLIGKRERFTHSILFRDTISLWSGRLSFIPAVRYSDASDFKGAVSFRGGIEIRPVKHVSIMANIEKTHRYPSFSELYFPDQGYIRGNPDLNPEEGWNLDAGVTLSSRYLTLQATFFKDWVENSILFVPISSTTIAPVNTSKAAIQGAEVSLGLDPVRYLHLGANYTYLDAKYTSNGALLPGRPRHEADGRIELLGDIGRGIGGAIFAGVSYKGEMPLNPQNTVFLRGRAVLDAGARLRIFKSYYINFEAKDITDVQAYDSRGFPLPRRSFFVTIGGEWYKRGDEEPDNGERDVDGEKEAI
jgi:outer membrane cobalamin receptor